MVSSNISNGICDITDDSNAVVVCILCLVSATLRRFDCTFDEDDYCGYSDESEGAVKWLRSKAHQHASPGNTWPICSISDSAPRLGVYYFFVVDSVCL